MQASVLLPASPALLIDADCCYARPDIAWSVCLSVCVLVARMNREKSAESIETSLEGEREQTRVGPRNH